MAVEYRFLKDNNWDTWRTEEELYYALRAFDRLDELAEPIDYYISGSHTTPNLETFGDSHPAWASPFGPLLNNNTPGPLNGYFLRDDVWFTNRTEDASYKSPDFVSSHIDSFNRPGSYGNDVGGIGVCPPSSSTYGCKMKYVKNCAAYPKIPYTPSPSPVYSDEESPDQVADMFLGLGLATNLVDDGPCSYNGYNLKYDAANSAWRIITWIPKIPMPWFLEDIAPNLIFPPLDITYTGSSPVIDYLTTGNTLPASWMIKNPLTLECVNAGPPGDYGVDQCFDGAWGPEFYSRACYAAINNSVTTQYPEFSLQTYLLQERSDSKINNIAYQAQAWVDITENEPFKDIEFSDIYSAFGDSWEATLPPPLDFININYTWHAIRNHAMDQHFCAPHLPLVYNINKGVPGTNFCPECHIGMSYQDLLNWAPECGPYKYNLDGIITFGNGEWSGTDRLAEWFHREGYGYSHIGEGENESKEYNGLDYMLLFDLYSYHLGTYLPCLINPYFTRNFNINYPQGTIGNESNKLTLNWLEYVSYNNIIAPGGNVTFRGAKQQDMYADPQFDAQPGSVFDAYIQDYVCQGPVGSYHYAELNGVPFEYNPTELPCHERHFSRQDSLKGKALDSLAKLNLTNGMFKGFRDSISRQLLEGNLSQNAINNLVKLGILNPDTTFKKNSAFVPDSVVDYNDFISLFPNPANTYTHVNYQLFEMSEIDIQLINVIGQDFTNLVGNYDKQQKAGMYEVKIDLENLVPGIYYVKIIIDNQQFVKKLSVVH